MVGKRFRQSLGVLALITAMLSVVRPLSILLRDFNPTVAGLSRLTLTPGVIGTACYIVMCFGLWGLVRSAPGSALLLVAGVLGLAAQLFPFMFLSALTPALRESGVATYADLALPSLATLLLVYGLSRTRLAPTVVAALGAMAALLDVARLVVRGEPLVIVYSMGTALQFAFLVALAVTLFSVPPSPEPARLAA